jgi:hypothetical protein
MRLNHGPKKNVPAEKQPQCSKNREEREACLPRTTDDADGLPPLAKDGLYSIGFQRKEWRFGQKMINPHSARTPETTTG